MMRYVSTRGQSESLDFEGVLLRGLAPDGGLYVPESLLQFSPEQLREFAKLSYAELASRLPGLCRRLYAQRRIPACKTTQSFIIRRSRR